MKCQQVGMILRNVKITEKPDMMLESDGDSHTLTKILPTKTIKISCTVGVPFEADMGYGQKLTYIATFENNALIYQQVVVVVVVVVVVIPSLKVRAFINMYFYY